VTVLDPAQASEAGGAAGGAWTEDAWDVRLALGAEGVLRQFNAAGALVAADVHVARRLGALCGEEDERVLLAAALAVRGPRLGHVCVDLSTVAATLVIEGERAASVDALAALPWPEPQAWAEAVARSPLVVAGPEGGARPLRLEGTNVYLDRYWREEQEVAADLRGRAASGAIGAASDVTIAGLLDRLFPGVAADDPQRRAAATAFARHLTVVAGGPGTGKTTTVARILALVHEHAAAVGGAAPLVALAAPTGKAAARLEEAVHEAGASMAELGVSEEVRQRLLATSATTLHRLLGWKAGNRARFRHDRFNRLPHDVVIVDETSMVSLTLMARLLEAVRPTARLVLVGDPEQLASVEAGAVLGDVVGHRAAAPSVSPLGPSIVVLQRVHRFKGTIASLASAIQAGDAGGAIDVLRSGGSDVTWLEADAAAAEAAVLAPLRERVVRSGRLLTDAAVAGDGRRALAALARFRVLCAHRRGPYGVSGWTPRLEGWLASGVDGFAARTEWYAGRPVLYTENDYGLQLYTGDTGVVVRAGEGDDAVLRAVFERRRELVWLSPQRLGRVETVHAMTVHKAQGSQFRSVALVLPDPSSPILTRELLYTAVTRAQRRLLVVGSEEAVRVAVQRPIARASGLRALLWGDVAAS
jgi:exodeoxyribonuclease V alpha subunit